ncbi:UNVERIFIED_CONTAM: hypothetical protein FKN15_052873 [Acipenser sinensis]
MPCDRIKPEVSAGVKTECSEVEIPQTAEPVPMKEEVLEVINLELLKVESTGIKAERSTVEIPQTAAPPELGPVLEMIKLEPLKVEFECLRPGREEYEDFKPALPEPLPELGPVRLQKCGVVLERISARERGVGEEGFPSRTQGSGMEDESSDSECSPAGSSSAAKARAGGEHSDCGNDVTQLGNFKTHQRTHSEQKLYRRETVSLL